MGEFESLVKGARQEIAAGHYGEASQGYKRALQMSNMSPEAEAKTRIESVDCLYKMGKFRYALRQIAKIERRACPPKDLHRLSILEANLRLELGEYTKARTIAQNVLSDLLPTGEHLLLGEAEHCLGRILLRTGHLKRAKEYFEDSLSSFRLINDKKGMLKAINNLAQIAFMAADWNEALKYLQKGLKISLPEWERQRAALMGNLGTLYRKMGDWKKALVFLELSLELKLKIGETLPIVKGSISLGRLYLIQRRWKEAEQLLLQALTLCQSHSLRREEAMSLESLGELAKERGDLNRSKCYYRRTLEIAKKLAPQGDLINQVQRRRAELLIMEGQDLEGASKCCEEALKVSQALGDKFEEACCYRVLALIYNAKGDYKLTETIFKKSIRLLKSIKERFELGKTLLAESGFTLSSLQDDQRRKVATEQLIEARRIFQGLGAHYEEGLVEIELAKDQMNGTNPDQALGPLESAEKIFKSISEKEGLQDILTLRAKMEERLATSSLLVRDEIAALDKLNHISPEDIDLLLHFLSERVGAERGFIAFRSNSEVELIPMSRYNLSSSETDFLLNYLVNLDNGIIRPGQPFICTSVAHNRIFLTLKKLKVENLMVFPFGDGRMEGILYVDRTRAERKGSFDQKDLNFFVLAADIVQLKVAELQKKELLRENLYLRERLEEKYGFGNIITVDSRMEEALRTAKSFKDSGLPILISGETGTGKELIARAIHYSSQRRGKNFVPVNCAAFTDTLLESEFFGHKKGSFTNAISDKKGLFEVAHGGTLFLDEVANASDWFQAKLLRVLEEMEIRRLGETRSQKVEVSIISATNKNLGEEVEAERFRKDLYYRLTGVEINLPPLRERKEDIAPLVYHFLELFTQKRGGKVRGVSKEAMELLTAYDWPGNVRELEHRIERAITLADEGAILTPDLIGLDVKQDVSEGIDAESKTLKERVGQLEREMIIAELVKQRWNKSKAAEALGLSRLGLRNKITRYNICEKT